MEIRFNVTGLRRKEMVKTISEALGGWEVRYMGAPTFSYQVGDFEIDRNGTLIFADRTDTKEVENVLEALEMAGFESEEPHNETTEQTATDEEQPSKPTAADDAEPLTDTESQEEIEATETTEEFVDSLSVSLPNDLDEHARHNLDAVIGGKASLFKAAFQTESLAYDEDEKKLTFPWFKYSSQEAMTDETNAFMLFLTKLVTYAKEAKRVTVKDKAVENPRYAFRCFLLRLGFIGQEYKAARKILMRNLTGNSSWKDGHRKEAAHDETAEQSGD